MMSLREIQAQQRGPKRCLNANARPLLTTGGSFMTRCAWMLCFGAAIFTLAGCQDPSPPREIVSIEGSSQPRAGERGERAEPDWSEAVSAVRRGDSVEIRLQAPIDDNQLADLAGLTGLRRLNLPRSQISDSGLARLPDLTPALELLRLGSPRIGDAGLASIAELKQLRFLHLIDSPVTDEGLAHLRRMTWLESFYLDGGQATDAGLSELIKALPNLHFHRDQQHLPDDPRSDDH